MIWWRLMHAPNTGSCFSTFLRFFSLFSAISRLRSARQLRSIFINFYVLFFCFRWLLLHVLFENIRQPKGTEPTPEIQLHGARTVGAATEMSPLHVRVPKTGQFEKSHRHPSSVRHTGETAQSVRVRFERLPKQRTIPVQWRMLLIHIFNAEQLRIRCYRLCIVDKKPLKTSWPGCHSMDGVA